MSRPDFGDAAAQDSGRGGASSDLGARTGPAFEPRAPRLRGVPEGAWTIVLRRMPDADAATARGVLLETEAATGLADLRVARRSGGLVLAYGAYDGPGSAEAQRDLGTVKRLEVEGVRPFRFAVLMPPEAGGSGRLSEWDLRGVRARSGEAVVYTLQVGVYGPAGAEEPTAEEVAAFRRAAEAAVRQLRAEGEEAFFFHGPQRSTVTVGVFGEDDHDGTVSPPIESVRLREARERHPYNLLNGRGIRERVRTRDGGEEAVLQRSFLVRAP